MLKGTRQGILRRLQPISIHGQASFDVFFTDVDDPDGQVHVARLGPEAIVGHNLEPGDRIEVEYVVAGPVKGTRKPGTGSVTSPRARRGPSSARSARPAPPRFSAPLQSPPPRPCHRPPDRTRSRVRRGTASPPYR